jgi:hypothetical protein
MTMHHHHHHHHAPITHHHYRHPCTIVDHRVPDSIATSSVSGLDPTQMCWQVWRSSVEYSVVCGYTVVDINQQYDEKYCTYFCMSQAILHAQRSLYFLPLPLLCARAFPGKNWHTGGGSNAVFREIGSALYPSSAMLNHSCRCVCVHVCVRAHLCTCVYMCACVRVCVCVCVCVCVATRASQLPSAVAWLSAKKNFATADV